MAAIGVSPPFHLWPQQTALLAKILGKQLSREYFTLKISVRIKYILTNILEDKSRIKVRVITILGCFSLELF